MDNPSTLTAPNPSDLEEEDETVTVESNSSKENVLGYDFR